MAPDLLSTIRYEIDERLSELRPLLAEHERLLEAVAALDVAGAALGVSGTTLVAKDDRSGAQIETSRRDSLAGTTEPAAARPVTSALEQPAAAAERSGDGDSSTRLNGKARSAVRLSRRIADPKPERVLRGVARETILAALEHGSHSVAELAVVTAMSGPSINGNLRKLVSEGAVVKTEREGKAAWALAVAA